MVLENKEIPDKIPVLIKHRDKNGISLYDEFRLVEPLEAVFLKLKHGKDFMDMTGMVSNNPYKK